MAPSRPAWEELCETMGYSAAMREAGANLLTSLDQVDALGRTQGNPHTFLATVAFLAHSERAETDFSVAELLLRYEVPMVEFLSLVEEQNARLHPGKPHLGLKSLTRTYVVDTVLFKKWKKTFENLFPRGFVGLSYLNDLSLQFGWTLFAFAKARLLGPLGSQVQLVEAWQVFAGVIHFLLAHIPRPAREGDFWDEVRDSVPTETYPLPPDAQAVLWNKLQLKHTNVDCYLDRFGRVIDELRDLLGLAQSGSDQGSNGAYLHGFLDADTFEVTTTRLKGNYATLWPTCVPIDEQYFHLARSAPASPSRQQSAQHDRSSEELLTPLRKPNPVFSVQHPSATPVTNQLQSMGWLESVQRDGCSEKLNRFFLACKAVPTLSSDISSRLEGACNLLEAHLQQREVACDTRQRCGMVKRLYYETLLKFLESEEKRLQTTDFSALLTNQSFHTSLIACCAEAISASYMMDETMFPAITKLLDIHAFDFMKVIDSFVKHHEAELPALLRKHFQEIEFRVIESDAWRSDSPLHGLMQEHAIRSANSQDSAPLVLSPAQTRAQNALHRFLIKCDYHAAARIRDLCVRLLLPSSVQRQVWACVKEVIHSRRTLLMNRHLDQIIMCSIYGVCKAKNMRPPEGVSFRDIIAEYKKRPDALAKTFREVCMATPDDTPQDIIKFYNQIFIPAMKEQLIEFCRTLSAEEDIRPTNQGIYSSPQRLSPRAEVYRSQQSRLLTPRTSRLYAFTDTPTHSASVSLRQINQSLNSNSNTDDAAQTLQALRRGNTSPSPPRRKRGLDLTGSQPQESLSSSMSAIQRRWREDDEKSASGSSSCRGA